MYLSKFFVQWVDIILNASYEIEGCILLNDFMFIHVAFMYF